MHTAATVREVLLYRFLDSLCAQAWPEVVEQQWPKAANLMLCVLGRAEVP